LDGDSSYMEIPHCKGVSGGHCRTVTARVWLSTSAVGTSSEISP
jgi:hypothetical protein